MEGIISSSDVLVTSVMPADLTEATITYGACPSGMSSINMLTGDTHNWGSGQVAQYGGCYDTFAITTAINTALSTTGVSIDKINYRWKWINGCFNVTTEDSRIYCDTNIEDRLDSNMKPTGIYADQFDTLVVDVVITDSAGNTVETRTYDYDTYYHWINENPHSTNEVQIGGSRWQITEDSIELYDHTTGTGTIYTPDTLGSVTFKTTAQDNGQWSGYYGPVVRDGEMWLSYRTNPCTLDAAYDASCPGYANAYAENLFSQQCSQNPQYDSQCPGYVQITSQPATVAQAAVTTGDSVVDSVIAIPNPIIIEPIVIEPIIVDIPTIVPIMTQTIIIPPATPIEVAATNLVDSLELQIEIELEQEIIPEPIIEEIVIDEPIEETTDSDPIDEPVEEEEKEDTQSDDTSDKPDEKGDEDAEENDEKSEEEEPDGDDKEEITDAEEPEEETIEDETEPEEAVEPDKKPEEPKKEISKKRVLTKSEKNKRMRELVAEKVLEASNALDKATTLEQQKQLQQTIMALIAFVPDFKDYGIDIEGGSVPVLPFYPDIPTVDHGFSRWFLNDSGFAILEDLQYN